ncbi:MAG: DUF533 domain-containing protein, partial [Methylococcales bacterium]|nr:DUF533 domain-containing protein [Methylococcales bacterium]
MSLVGTLGKMAVGAIAARGVGKLMGGSSGLAGTLSGLLGGAGGAAALSGLLGGGGGEQDRGQQGGGLGALLGGAGGQQGGGLGGLLSSLSGGGQQEQGSSEQQSGGLGGLLNDALQGKESAQPTQDQEQQAEVMLRAMISAAKSDGEIDAEEQRKITEHLGDVSTEELELVRQIMKEPQDLPRLISSVPAGMEQQVYLMSLLAINLDSKPEAQYLDQFAKGLNINEQQCNEIHAKLGVPNLYG